MFNNTKCIIERTKRDIENLVTLFQFGTQIIFILYQTVMLFTASNIWYLHLSLLIISLAFLIFDIIITKDIKRVKRTRLSIFRLKEHNAELKELRAQRGNVNRVKCYASHTIKALVLGTALFSIITAPDTVHPLSIIGTTVMTIAWLAQLVLEVAKRIFFGRLDAFKEALQADIEAITAPITRARDAAAETIHTVADIAATTKRRVGGFFSKFFGKKSDSDSVTPDPFEEEETV